MNNAEQFFNSLPQEDEKDKDYSILQKDEGAEQAPEPEKDTTSPEKDGEEEPERKKPLRSERRAEKQREFYEQQLAEEREARIRLEEQVRAIAQKDKENVDPDIEKLLKGGIELDEGAKILSNLLTRTRQEAIDAALERYQAAREEDDGEVNAIHSQIETDLENIEDRYGVDLTDDTETRNAFLDFAESIAPQDSDALPNMDAAWKLFQATRKAPTSNVERKREIASRSMQRSSMAPARPAETTTRPMTFDSLRSHWDKLIGN